MLRHDVLPQEFDQIRDLVNYVQRKSANEYAGSCPQCGGEVHKGGDWPDRFVMFRVSRYGFSLGFCRKCGYKWTPNNKNLSKEDVERFRKEQIEIEKARLQAAARALEFLQNDKVWEQFYSQNNAWSLRIFEEWGIAKSWVDYLQLGLMPDYLVRHQNHDEDYHSPAVTIPVWNVGGVVRNIKLRVLNPRDSMDRYRNFYSMGQSFLFVPLYDLPLKGAGIVVEGEKKAIVMEQKIDDINFRVVGVQSKTPSHEVLQELRDLDPVYVWLDPDAFEKASKEKETPLERMVRLIGAERVRVIQCPVKCDDGIVKYGLEPRSYIRNARKA